MINYQPSPTGEKFHADASRVRAVKGPVGSGKSVMCTADVVLRMVEQAAHTDGVRRTRWAVIRNTAPELKSTTIKTVQDWIPEQVRSITYSSPITMKVVFALPDNTRVESELIFIALDAPEDVGKLKSLEVTGVWLNEASELDRETFNMALQRAGRYPSMMQGGPTWHGVILDTNPPDTSHWIYELFEMQTLPGYRIFHQPPAIEKNPVTGDWEGNPTAENVMNHKEGFGYWLEQVHGKDDNWVNVYLRGEYGSITGDQTVYRGEWDPQVHLSKVEIPVNRDYTVLVGFDWGLSPAVVFGQLVGGGKLRILKEFVPQEDTALEELMEDLRPFLLQHFGGCAFDGWGDPAGRGRSPIDKRTPFEIVSRGGIRCRPTHTNDYLPRREAVSAFLNRREGFTVNPSCKMIAEGFSRGYFYKRTTGGVLRQRPEKNKWSHPMDALQYLCLGARTGMSRQVVVGGGTTQPIPW